jgi:hypothetical protein
MSHHWPPLPPKFATANFHYFLGIGKFQMYYHRRFSKAWFDTTWQENDDNSSLQFRINLVNQQNAKQPMILNMGD